MSKAMKILGLFSLLCLLGAGPEAGGLGSLKFEESSFDFGEVYRGISLSHRFKFVNSGTGPLTIQGVHAACGCTAVEVEKGRKYQPGESGFVDIRLDTTDFAGSLVKTVTVMSNEKILPDRNLTLRAHVKSEVEADPPLVDFGDSFSKEGASRTIRIKPVQGFKLTVKDLGFNAQLVDASVQKDGADYLVTVTLKPGLAPGFVKETVYVRNNSTHLKELPIPVRANVKGNIDYLPAYIEFGAIGPADVSKRSITMRGQNDFEVTGSRAELIVNGRRIADASKYISINTLPHEKDKKLVSVELKNEAKVQGSVHGKLYFETSDPSQKELAVDFYAFFR